MKLLRPSVRNLVISLMNITEQLEKYNSNDTEHCLKKLRRKYSITSTKERNSIFESECKPSQDIHFSKIRSKPTCD